MGGAGVGLVGCGYTPFAPHLWIPAFAGMTLGEWATPQWFVVGLPRPSGAWRPPVHPSISLRANGPTAPPLDPGFRRDGGGGDW